MIGKYKIPTTLIGPTEKAIFIEVIWYYWTISVFKVANQGSIFKKQNFNYNVTTDYIYCIKVKQENLKSKSFQERKTFAKA